MPITTVDPNTALIVVDLQKGVAMMPTTHPLPAVVANAAKLAAAFRLRGAPVVLVNVAGLSPGRCDVMRPSRTLTPDLIELMTELDRQPSDLLVTKYAMGAFHGTSLDFHLRRRSVTQVVVCGVVTSLGVESTARGAHDRGYHLTIVTDAITDFDAAAHSNSVERVFPRIAETGSTADLLGLLA